ncbi:hypothetical protein P7K49_016924, partial [Saguinus oedipus]
MGTFTRPRASGGDIRDHLQGRFSRPVFGEATLPLGSGTRRIRDRGRVSALGGTS